MSKIHLYIAVIVTLATCAACTTWFGEPDTNAVDSSITDVSSQLTETSKSVGDSANKVESSAKDIKDEANKIKSKAPAVKSEVNKIHKDADDILDETTNLKIASASLDQTVRQLATAKQQLESLENKIKAMKLEMAVKDEKIKKMDAEIAASVQTKMWWVIMIGIGLIAAAAIMLYNGNTKAIGLGIAGILVIIIAVGLAVYLKTFAIIGLAFVVMALIAAGVKYREIQTHAIYERGFRELVHVIEVIKDLLDEETRLRIFGDRMHPGDIEKIQTEETKRLVLRTRQEEKAKWEPTIKKHHP